LIRPPIGGGGWTSILPAFSGYSTGTDSVNIAWDPCSYVDVRIVYEKDRIAGREEIADGIKSVQIRNFEFDTDFPIPPTTSTPSGSS